MNGLSPFLNIWEEGSWFGIHHKDGQIRWVGEYFTAKILV